MKMLKVNTLTIAKTTNIRTLEAKAGTTERIRGSKWQSIRNEVFNRSAYRCASCDRVLAQHHGEVDHITPLEQGGSNGRDNLQLLCSHCHAAKTALEAGNRAGRWGMTGGGIKV